MLELNMTMKILQFSIMKLDNVKNHIVIKSNIGGDEG